MKQKLYIASCNLVKQGEKNGRQWFLYLITDPKGVKYSTFEPKYNGMVGHEVEVEVVEQQVEKNGVTYTNRTIIEPKRENPVMDIVRKLEGRVVALENRLLAIEVQDGVPEVNLPEEINAEDLPW